LVALSIGCVDAKAADYGGGEQHNAQLIGLPEALHSFPPRFERFGEAIIDLLFRRRLMHNFSLRHQLY
jgi:hypothetical protein